jgi:hypothetical protein
MAEDQVGVVGIGVLDDVHHTLRAVVDPAVRAKTDVSPSCWGRVSPIPIQPPFVDDQAPYDGTVAFYLDPNIIAIEASVPMFLIEEEHIQIATTR